MSLVLAFPPAPTSAISGPGVTLRAGVGGKLFARHRSPRQLLSTPGFHVRGLVLPSAEIGMIQAARWQIFGAIEIHTERDLPHPP
jgi:hypothetical protein